MKFKQYFKEKLSKTTEKLIQKKTYLVMIFLQMFGVNASRSSFYEMLKNFLNRSFIIYLFIY